MIEQGLDRRGLLVAAELAVGAGADRQDRAGLVGRAGPGDQGAEGLPHHRQSFGPAELNEKLEGFDQPRNPVLVLVLGEIELGEVP